MFKFFVKASLQKSLQNFIAKIIQSELKTLEWDILNLDRLINLKITNKRRTSIIQSGN